MKVPVGLKADRFKAAGICRLCAKKKEKDLTQSAQRKAFTEATEKHCRTKTIRLGRHRVVGNQWLKALDNIAEIGEVAFP
jgi:hypothetical protein